MTYDLLKTKPRKILLAIAKRVGDVLFTTPGIALLKKRLPHTPLDVLVYDANVAEIFENNPYIEKILVAELDDKKTLQKMASDYDVVINLMIEYKPYFEHISTPFLSIGEADFTKHRAEQVLEYVQSLLQCPIDVNRNYVLNPFPHHFQSIEQTLEKQGVDVKNDILIGCHLGCHRIARRFWQFWRKTRHQHIKVWPMENYVQLAKKLEQHDKRIRFIITGSQNEKFLAKQFLKHHPSAINLIGKTTLFEITALMKRLKTYITHDTGTLHIACLSGVPLVALFGATPPAYTGPYPMQSHHTVINKTGLNEISVDEVFDAVVSKIDGM